ncbi:unnamed protein product [Rotaria sordida]|uniref:Uncharacterized protein n=1 Tax=Rotaria sordida TaxID=392033 RepID=A0A815GMQ6_9BILA|nr:unnamed protein product [Rotaria sordida]CAF1597412.1 unnamed protein product [Rotaria sordida]
MIAIQTRCDGIFMGHAIVSKFDISCYMALQLSESLLELKRFDGPNIMSRYLYLYHTKRYDFGETMKVVYQNLKDKTKNYPGHSSVCREDFLFDQLIIDETVKLTDKKLGGYTAGCGPVHRSFPLALCPWIDDDNLFNISKNEATLTHFNPLAGQVAGIVNLICRSLLKNNTWHDAVQSAFLTPSLHTELSDVCYRYSRWSTPSKTTHPAYAPTVLQEALHYVTISNNIAEVIEKVKINRNVYCLPIVGVLSGALWGIPLDMYKDKTNDVQLKTIRDTANKLSQQWISQCESVNA